MGAPSGGSAAGESSQGGKVLQETILEVTVMKNAMGCARENGMGCDGRSGMGSEEVED